MEEDFTSLESYSSVNTEYTPEKINVTSEESEITSNYTNPIKYLRSRNISFDATKLKPVTRFYPFFQGIDVSKYIIPKLLEITMVSGKFQDGETVISDPHYTAAKISFRLCTPNHKSGPYNNPIETFSLLPYTQQPIQTTYSESSKFLNVDVRSLELPSEVNFYGDIALEMPLIGKTSGAIAKITNIRLVSDNYGRLIGSLYIPEPSTPENPMWINGQNTFTLTDFPVLSVLPNAADVGGTLLNQSSGSATFTSSGILNVTEKNVLTTKNITITPAFYTNTATVTNYPSNGSTTIPIFDDFDGGGGGDGGGGDGGGGGGGGGGGTIPRKNFGTLYTNFGVNKVGNYADASLSTLAAAAGLPTKLINSIKDGMKYADYVAAARQIEAALAAKGVDVKIVTQGQGSAQKNNTNQANLKNTIASIDKIAKDFAVAARQNPLKPSGQTVRGAASNMLAPQSKQQLNKIGATVASEKFSPQQAAQRAAVAKQPAQAPRSTPGIARAAAPVNSRNIPSPPRSSPPPAPAAARFSPPPAPRPAPSPPPAPRPSPPPSRSCGKKDPLAQSFFVQEDTGIFLTSVEVFFATKSENLPVTLQIRTMVAGVPSEVVIPYSEVTLNPDRILLSTDGSASTKFDFPSPVYLAGPQQQNVRHRNNESNTEGEYAIVLLSDSTEYTVFISRMNEVDLQTNTIISKQPTLGSLFKSQNGATWNPSQYDDLKYVINRADFVGEGLVRFFNPILGLGNKKATVTSHNQFLPLSKTILVGLGSTGYNTNIIKSGLTISQGSASATLIGIAGGITVGSGVTVVNAGVGYTNGTFSNVSLETETGYGKGAKADVVVSSNSVVSVNITSEGIGYKVGDSLLVSNLGKNVGYGAKVVVKSLGSNNSFVLDNVQGKFVSGISTLSYLDSSGTLQNVGAGVTISSIFEDPFYDGLHMKVQHINHGMHSPTNYVRISDMRPVNTEVNSPLNLDLTANETTSLTVVSGVGFTQFEGKEVTSANPGYVIIGTEVIQYTGVSANTLTSLTRGIDGTQVMPAFTGVPVYKYEFNGISLRRINKVHNFAEVDTENHPITLNSYYIKIDTDATDFDNVGIGSYRKDDLYFKKTAQMGESGVVLTNNIQYEEIEPIVRHIDLAKTSLTARVRTFTGTSIGGKEPSFIDNGFQDVSLYGRTYFETPNIICSDINESRFINESPGNRSFAMEFYMSSDDSRVSPVIDSTGVSVRLTSNLLNNPIGIDTVGKYAYNDLVRSLDADPHSSVYVSKPVRLKLPANSLKVILSASLNDTNDIRVLYRLFRDDAPTLSQNYELFPGYSNYQVDGNGIKQVIDASLNDGSPDSRSNRGRQSELLEYEYSVDDLPQFSGFSIKIVMAGTNQAIPPLLQDLRAIATVKPRI